MAEPIRGPTADKLSPTEVRVMDLVAQGDSNLEIAGKLRISHNTVSAHIRSVMSKTHTPNRTSAAIVYLKNGVRTTSPWGHEPKITLGETLEIYRRELATLEIRRVWLTEIIAILESATALVDNEPPGLPDSLGTQIHSFENGATP